MPFKKEEDSNEHQIYYKGQEEEIQELEAEVERLKKARRAIELERAELKAEYERQREEIARQASTLQALLSPTAQGQLSEHETMQKDVYVGTVSSLDEAVEHHRRLPHHLRTISVTPLDASNIDIFAFRVPRRGVGRLIRSLGLQRIRQDHELDVTVSAPDSSTAEGPSTKH